jgi:hypothetical protein
MRLMVTPIAHLDPRTPFNIVHWEETMEGNGGNGGKHHPTLDFLAPSRRAPTEQRCQRRTLIENIEND